VNIQNSGDVAKKTLEMREGGKTAFYESVKADTAKAESEKTKSRKHCPVIKNKV